jgi:hypothetical protein
MQNNAKVSLRSGQNFLALPFN